MRETPDPFYLKLLCGSMNTTTATRGLQNTIDAYLRGPFWFVWSIFVCCSILQLVSDFSILNFDCIYIIGILFLIFSVVLMLAVPIFEGGQKERTILDVYYNAYYYDNTKIGEGRIVLKFHGNYEGQKIITFDIK